MTVSLIAAIARDRGIGYQNKLLVHLPPDLKHFKAITSGHMVIMGQTTYQSMGRALPNRENIVLTKDPDFKIVDAKVMYSLEEALEYAKQSGDEEVFFIGGASIYAQSIKYADKLYLTIIDAVYPADTYFPDYSEFKNIISESPVQEHEGIKFKYLELSK
ncbi:MAG: dihydrofolate reductase [Patescibacteria group bacterium]|nr:dihydrofolate reductase [Patescibacteria group bacterium]